jgi:hypothetical protein
MMQNKVPKLDATTLEVGFQNIMEKVFSCIH